MKTIAIVGATGLVGEKLTEILQDKLTEYKVRFFGSASVGTRKTFRNKRVTIEYFESITCGGIDYAVFTANEDVALWAK